MLVHQEADDDFLHVSLTTIDADAIAFAEGAVRFGVIAINLDLAALAGAFRFGACLEQTRNVEPDVETKAVAQIKISTLPFAFSVLTNATVCSSRP